MARRDQRPRAGDPGRGSEAPGRAADPLFDRLRVRRQRGTTPYREDDRRRPAQRLRREQARRRARDRGRRRARTLILRTSWVYGLHGQNFLLTMRRLAAERDELRIVADQFGVPNWSRALAEATARPAEPRRRRLTNKEGLYHLSGRGRASWFDFARAIFDDADRPRVVPITTAGISDARPPAGIGVLATGNSRRPSASRCPIGAKCWLRARLRRSRRPGVRIRARRRNRELEPIRMRDWRGARQRCTGAGGDDRIHPECDAVQQRIVAVPGQRAQWFEAPLERPLIYRRHFAARAGLDHFQRHVAADDLVDVILVVGIDAGQQQVRAKTIDRQRRRRVARSGRPVTLPTAPAADSHRRMRCARRTRRRIRDCSAAVPRNRNEPAGMHRRGAPKARRLPRLPDRFPATVSRHTVTALATPD